MNTNIPYYNNLDGLRGIAAIAVLVFHFFLAQSLVTDISIIGKVRMFTEVLQHGVTLFFVLSGFVITRILFNVRKSENYFKAFYWRRILRIFPLYYLYLVVHYYIFPLLLHGETSVSFIHQLPVWLYLQNLSWLTGLPPVGGPGHFWSLAVEEHFYLLWPFMIWVTPKKYFFHLVVLLLLLSFPIKYHFFTSGIDINYNTFSRYDSIMMGCLIALIEKKSNYKLNNWNTFQVVISGLTVFAVGFLVYILQDQFPVLKATIKHFILGLFFFILIFYLISLKTDNVINTFLKSKYMQYLGKISYGLYVWHMLSISIVSLMGINLWYLNIFLVTVLTILISNVSYYYFEKWFLKFKSKVKYS